MTVLDETKIVDLDSELADFGRMVAMEVQHQVMVVCDHPGTGKTELLRKLRLHCDRDHGIPVALAMLGKSYMARQDEFAVVKRLHKELKSTGATMPNFDDLERALGLRDTGAFLERLRALSAFVDMRNAAVGGAGRVAAMMFNIENAETVVLPDWNEETAAKAEELCVDAFLIDLREYARENPVVLLFDNLDQVSEDLCRWILKQFVIRPADTNWGNDKLIVVMAAGKDSADIVYGRVPHAQRSRISVTSRLNDWNLDEVRSFLRAHGLSIRDAEVDALHRFVSEGYPPGYLIGVATAMASYGGRP